MKAIAARSTETHKMLLVKQRTDTLTGEEWDLLECPTCGYLCKVQWKPYKSKTLCVGEGMLTDEDAERITQLCREGPVGRVRAQEMMSAVPGHAYVRVPTEDELRQVAEKAGRLEEFEESVEQAIIDGKPLLTVGLGGAKASAWPKGVKGR